MAKSTKGMLERALQENIKNIRKEFWFYLGIADLPKIITDVIRRGISPVMGAGARLKKYSKSYLDQIEGKVAFFTGKNGNVIAVKPDYVESSSISINKKTGKVKRTGVKQTLGFSKGLGYGKKKSPVSMHLTGKMLDSLEFNTKTGTLIAHDEKWDWHNDGVPENNLPERRLLPNRKGESFNRLIQTIITDALARATGKEVNKVKRLIKVSFNFK